MNSFTATAFTNLPLAKAMELLHAENRRPWSPSSDGWQNKVFVAPSSANASELNNKPRRQA
jgi:hypothetical protein